MEAVCSQEFNCTGTGTGKKTPGGAGTHTGRTQDTRAHKGTRVTPTNLTTIQPSKSTNTQVPSTRTSARRPTLTSARRPTQQPRSRSRPLPAVDSEETAPSEPDPAASRSQSTCPRACSKAVGEMKARAADA